MSYVFVQINGVIDRYRVVLSPVHDERGRIDGVQRVPANVTAVVLERPLDRVHKSVPSVRDVPLVVHLHQLVYNVFGPAPDVSRRLQVLEVRSGDVHVGAPNHEPFDPARDGFRRRDQCDTAAVTPAQQRILVHPQRLHR